MNRENEREVKRVTNLESGKRERNVSEMKNENDGGIIKKK